MKPNRQNVMKYLMKRMSWNSGKLLNSWNSKGRYGWYERDRDSEDQCYFLVLVKGSRIIAKRIKYEIDGVGINTYMNLFLPTFLSGEEPEVLPERKTEVLVNIPISEYLKFDELYEAATPSLSWHHFDDDNELETILEEDIEYVTENVE